MAEKSKTKDELFMLRLYEEASKQPDIETPVDRYRIGELAGLQERAVNAICHLLIQANFIRKEGSELISITPHGIKLVLQIKSFSGKS